jgi:hypothetical protein
MLDTSTKLLDILPEGHLRENHELKAAVLYAKQVNLNQQLKKFGPVAILQMELQMNILERQFAALENGTQMRG